MQATEKEGSAPNITKFPHSCLLLEGKAPTLHFIPWNTLIAIPQLLGSIFPPSPSWGECYEYHLQHSKLRQAAATDGIWLGKGLVMWTSAFAIWFIAWIKVTSFQAGMNHIKHKIVAFHLIWRESSYKEHNKSLEYCIQLNFPPFLPIPCSFPADMRSLVFREVVKENKYLHIGCSSRATWNWLLKSAREEKHCLLSMTELIRSLKGKVCCRRVKKFIPCPFL